MIESAPDSQARLRAPADAARGGKWVGAMIGAAILLHAGRLEADGDAGPSLGGFRLGMNVAEARKVCDRAGHKYIAAESAATCSGAAADVGIPEASVDLTFCGQTACAVDVWGRYHPAVFEEVRRRLVAEHGNASAAHDGKTGGGYGWASPGGIQTVLVITHRGTPDENMLVALSSEDGRKKAEPPRPKACDGLMGFAFGMQRPRAKKVCARLGLRWSDDYDDDANTDYCGGLEDGDLLELFGRPMVRLDFCGGALCGVAVSGRYTRERHQRLIETMVEKYGAADKVEGTDRYWLWRNGTSLGVQRYGDDRDPRTAAICRSELVRRHETRAAHEKHSELLDQL